MKTVKNKQLVVGADFAGYPLKEAVVAHLKEKGWEITDMGVRADSDPNDTDLMFHKLAIDELEAFDYEEYKKNGFKVNKLGDFDIKLEKKPE